MARPSKANTPPRLVDLIEKRYNVSMKTVGANSVARLDAAIVQPYREIVAETGLLVLGKPCGQAADPHNRTSRLLQNAARDHG